VLHSKQVKTSTLYSKAKTDDW